MRVVELILQLRHSLQIVETDLRRLNSLELKDFSSKYKCNYAAVARDLDLTLRCYFEDNIHLLLSTF